MKVEEEQGFLEDDDFDNFGFQLEPDLIQKLAERLPNPLKDYLSQGSAQQRKIKCAVISGAGICLILVLLILSIASIAIIASAVTGGEAPSSESSDDGETLKPQEIPDKWESDVSFTIEMNGQLVLESEGHMWNDNGAKLSRVDFITYPTPDRNYYNNISQYLNVQTNWILDNDICRRYTGDTYSNIFSFLSYKPTYIGQIEVEGFEELCDLWQKDSWGGKWNQSFALTFCNAVPYLLLETAASNEFEFNYSQSIYFTNFLNVTVPATIFKTPDACLKKGVLCPPGNPQVQTIEMYLFHDNSTSSLADQNTADDIGAAALLCDRLESTLSENNLITVIDVQVNTTWGQYGNCEESNCNGANGISVGRAASFRVKPLEGQCSDNSDTGSWFSLTGNIACEVNQPLGEDGCAWKPVMVKTTFSADCLISKGFLNACASDPYFPFTAANTILQEAVLSCPYVAPEYTAEL